MSFISSQTCVTFEESSTAQHRIRFMNDGGCASYIGMNGGEQQLWFGDGCTIVSWVTGQWAEFYQEVGSRKSKFRAALLGGTAGLRLLPEDPLKFKPLPSRLDSAADFDLIFLNIGL